VRGAVVEERSEGLLVIAKPLEVADRLCNSMAEVPRVDEEALFLEADPA
jgi:hypothetical protein